MSKKDKHRFKCFVCGKKLTQHEAETQCYQYYEKVACCHHPGIEEWYQDICDEEDKKLLSKPVRDFFSDNDSENK